MHTLGVLLLASTRVVLLLVKYNQELHTHTNKVAHFFVVVATSYELVVGILVLSVVSGSSW